MKGQRVISDIATLRSLVLVVERGSIVAAARECGYTPGAISRQLGRLQRRLGVNLFEPDGRGIRPNERCVRLADDARRLIAEVHRFDDAALALINASDPAK
jgi:DNA-binding transcriptional LysR family regulator